MTLWKKIRSLFIEACPNCLDAEYSCPDESKRGACVLCDEKGWVWRWHWLHRVLVTNRTFAQAKLKYCVKHKD